jgi:hypothetical protein
LGLFEKYNATPKKIYKIKKKKKKNDGYLKIFIVINAHKIYPYVFLSHDLMSITIKPTYIKKNINYKTNTHTHTHTHTHIYIYMENVRFTTPIQQLYKTHTHIYIYIYIYEKC